SVFCPKPQAPSLKPQASGFRPQCSKRLAGQSTLVTLARSPGVATMRSLSYHVRSVMHTHTPSSHWWPILAAATALIVVHGFGRFVYAPLLPLLVDDGLISLPQAASLATWNYIGYLPGAMLALFLYQRGFGRQALLTMLLS